MNRFLAPCALLLATTLGFARQGATEQASSAVMARYKAAADVVGLVEAQRAQGREDAQFPEEGAAVRWSLRLAEAAVAAEVAPASQAYADHLQRMEKQMA